MKDIKMLVASHKIYEIPDDPMYLPVWVGARINPPKRFTPDDTGENISYKNKNYCELTAMYWAWKNLDADYIGLCHYRRYFKGNKSFSANGKTHMILSLEKANDILDDYPVILPRKRNYYIETTYTQYAHAHHSEDLDITRLIIAEMYPEYMNAFDNCMKKTDGHKFNMFIMRRDIFDEYCTWLFDLLFELEKRLDISSYSENDSRVFGFVAERLLDIWVEKNSISYSEVKVINLENEHWLRKIARFLIRKLTGKKQV